MNKPVAWMDENENVIFEKNWAYPIPLYTHPVKELTETNYETVFDGEKYTTKLVEPLVKELNDGGEPVKNATYWKRQHDNLLMKLNTCAIKVSELEKKLAIRTRELIDASFYEHDYKTMMANNKPVAWMIRRDENITKGIGHEIQLTLMDANSPEFWVKGKVAKGYTVYPLYTHPVKELTDEEIIAEAEKHDWLGLTSESEWQPEIDFARAILRKAQEK